MLSPQQPVIFLCQCFHFIGMRSEVKALHQLRIIHYPKTVPIIETSNPNGLAALILKGIGIVVLPALVAKSSSFCELIFIPLHPPIESRSLFVVQKKDYTLPPAGLKMLDLLHCLLQQKRDQKSPYIEYQ